MIYLSVLDTTGKAANEARLEEAKIPGVQDDPSFSSECWYLLMMRARALELYFHPLVSEGWNSLSNRNGGKRWWFGPQTRQTAGSLLLYQLNRPL